MTKTEIRQAYLILTKAVRDKQIDKTKTSREQTIQIDDSAYFTRQLQDIGVYLDVVK